MDSHVVVKRLKDDSVFKSRVNQRRMKSVARSHIGKKYDLLFAWDQKKMYCSELVFRIFFDGAGIHLGKVERFGDMNLSSPVVKSLVRKRVGKNLDVNEPIITPVSIMEDDQLKTVAKFQCSKGSFDRSEDTARPESSSERGMIVRNEMDPNGPWCCYLAPFLVRHNDSWCDNQWDDDGLVNLPNVQVFVLE